LNPSRSGVWFQLGATYVLKGDLKAAIPAFEKALTLPTVGNPRYRPYLAYVYAKDGRTAESRQILHELVDLRERQYVSSFGIALIHDALGEKAAALAALERASQEHALEFSNIDEFPPFKTLAAEPRYQELMGRPEATR
jgi:tetratricopeptide (TPR) repeat protein